MLCWPGMLDEEENRDNLVTENSVLLDKATGKRCMPGEDPNPDNNIPCISFISYESVAQLEAYIMHPYEHSKLTKANVFAWNSLSPNLMTTSGHSKMGRN